MNVLTTTRSKWVATKSQIPVCMPLGLLTESLVTVTLWHVTRSVPSAAAYGSQKSVEDATSSISRLHLVSDASPTSSEEVAVSSAPEAPAFDCTCGMPLCICEAPASSKVRISTVLLIQLKYAQCLVCRLRYFQSSNTS